MLAVQRVASVSPYKGEAQASSTVSSQQEGQVLAGSTACTAVASVVGDDRAVREGSQGFPRTARLLKADEFATLFRMRPLKRSEHFVVYARPRVVPERMLDRVPDATSLASEAASGVVSPVASAPDASMTDASGALACESIAGGVLRGRMGLVLGKKFAARAATRNMMRRALRETFRLRAVQFAGWDVLIRLNLRFDKQRFPGAASPVLKRVCRAEIVALLDEAARQIARARRTGVMPLPSRKRPIAPAAVPAPVSRSASAAALASSSAVVSDSDLASTSMSTPVLPKPAP